MKKKNLFKTDGALHESPIIERIDIAVEAGFASSGDDDPNTDDLEYRDGENEM